MQRIPRVGTNQCLLRYPYKIRTMIVNEFCMGKKRPKPTPRVNLCWTPELAHVCGLMVADGCLLSGRSHMIFTSNDLQLLQTFKDCLGLENAISWKPSGFTGRHTSQVQFRNASLYQRFLSVGITPRKTHTVGRIAVPDEYFFDYLRGEFDGDGSSNAYWDTRWRSSVLIYLTFTSAGRRHLEWIHERVQTLLKVSGVLRPQSRAYMLRFAKHAARKLYTAMYPDGSVPCLRRKKERLDRQWAAEASARGGISPPGLHNRHSVLRIA